jgi:diguanylate cyclase (GGDEF)-like protein
MDLDRFKTINDSLGHSAGDLVLKEVAKRLQQCTREDTTISRLGGDEFLLLIPRLELREGAAALAQRIITVLQVPIVVEGHEITVSPSIGIALHPFDGTNAETLVRHADAAMYRAKNEGRNRYCYYTEQLQATVTHKLTLEGELRRAISAGHLQPHYQPVYDAATGLITGAETLVRWPHASGRARLPAEFLALAQECGLMEMIDHAMLRAACTDAAQWRRQQLGLQRVSVNVAAATVLQPGFADQVLAVLQDTALEPQHLELELTEDTLIQDLQQVNACLSVLRTVGVQVALDDFGMGFSSLSHLRQLPINRIKIDRSFVQHLPYSTRDVALVRSIITLADNLDLQIVAEGVESQEQLRHLNMQGCHELQGYLISPPLPKHEFEALIHTWPGSAQQRSAVMPPLRVVQFGKE